MPFPARSPARSAFRAAGWRDFARDEAGSTHFSLFWFCLITMLGGLGLDSANGFRHRQLLQQTADAAAHAGTVALSTGASEADVRAAVRQVIDANLPPEQNGPLLSDPEDIRLVRYDVRDRVLTEEGRANAVSVTLHRDETTENPVDLMLLQIAGMVGDDIGP